MNASDHLLALPSGYKLGKYHFKDILGCGGFGITYLAEDQTLKRQVAIKELLPNDIATRVEGTTVAAKTKGDEGSLAWALERFVNEGRALAACEHPNVVHVYEIVEANGTAYMVTKYEEGCSMEQWLKELGRPPNEAELRGVLVPLLSGLEKVHQTGFLHRDIKPENIYIASGGRPLLLDFGSARQAVSNRSMAMTSIVSCGYAPFEQYYEDGNQGAWSDIYAFGAVMYRAITGKKPPEATRRLKTDSCEKLSTHFTGKYKPEFLEAIDQALSVNEGDRPQSVAEWLAMLGEGPANPSVSVTKTQPAPKASPSSQKPAAPVAGKPRRFSGAMVGGAVGVAVVVAAAVIWSFTRSKPVPTPQPAAQKVVQTAPVAAPEPAAVAPVAVAPAPAVVQNAAEQKSPDSSNGAPAQPAALVPAVASETAKPAEPPIPEAAPAIAQATPIPAPAAPIDPHIVGLWQNGITKAKREHWETWSNGYWLMWGPINDSGSFTAAGGQIHQYSNNTGQSTDATYDFEDGALVTHTAMGGATWHHPPSASDSESSSQKKKSGSDTPVKTFFSNLFHGHS